MNTLSCTTNPDLLELSTVGENLQDHSFTMAYIHIKKKLAQHNHVHTTQKLPQTFKQTDFDRS